VAVLPLRGTTAGDFKLSHHQLGAGYVKANMILGRGTDVEGCSQMPQPPGEIADIWGDHAALALGVLTAMST
jgi:hypothetical protein